MSQEKPKSVLPKFRSILLVLGTVLALGVLVFVSTRFTNQQQMLVEPYSTAVYPLESRSIGLPETETTRTEISDITDPIDTTITAEGKASTTRTTNYTTATTTTATTTTESASALDTLGITPTPGLSKTCAS